MEDNFTKNVKWIREQKGLTQTQIASLFGLPRTTWGSYESGKSHPKYLTLIEIAEYIGTSVEKLITSDLSNVQLSNFDKTNDDTKYSRECPDKRPDERPDVRENSLEYQTLSNREKDQIKEQKKRALELDSDPGHHNPKPGYHYSPMDPKSMTREWLELFIDSQRETIQAQHDHIQLLKQVLNKIEEERSENTQKKNDK